MHDKMRGKCNDTLFKLEIYRLNYFFLFNNEILNKDLDLLRKLKFSFMKSILLLLTCFVFTSNLFAQETTEAPYLKTKLIPDFTIMTCPDSTKFTNKDLKKNQNTIIIYFGPDCGHCSVFAKKMMDSISSFKNTQIVMVSSFEYSHIKKFYEDNKLNTCPFITVGRDAAYFFIGHYEVRQFPCAILYNKKGKYVARYDSEIEIENLLLK